MYLGGGILGTILIVAMIIWLVPQIRRLATVPVGLARMANTSDRPHWARSVTNCISCR
jgi:hypothetical protein